MSIFERHKVLSIIMVFALFLIISTVSIELLLRSFTGLGDPVLYDSDPLYGYRPIPSQQHKRIFGAMVKFNNLGLRADEDWDEQKKNKILFIGDSVTYGGSHIDNQDLFSNLVGLQLPDFKTGNAGVNAWGVENIYGLLVEARFNPAQIYVITLPTGDFYRGKTRIQGLPYYNTSPRYALLELWHFFCYRQNNERYKSWEDYADDNRIEYVVNKSAVMLKETINYLRKAGYKVLVFISPYRDQVVKDAPKDKLVSLSLKQYVPEAILILDKLKKMNNIRNDNLFYDGVHLNKTGHKIWAEIITNELKKELSF